MAGYMSIIGCMSLAYFYPTFTSLLGYSDTDAQYVSSSCFVSSSQAHDIAGT